MHWLKSKREMTLREITATPSKAQSNAYAGGRFEQMAAVGRWNRVDSVVSISGLLVIFRNRESWRKL